MGAICILLASVLSETPTISPEDAPKHIGETVTVRMPVAVVSATIKSRERIAILFPSESEDLFKQLAIEVYRSAFVGAEKELFKMKGKTIEVTGLIFIAKGTGNPEYPHMTLRRGRKSRFCE